MQLNKKKNLAAKVLGMGKDRIIFMPSSLNEIKEAITRQDIMDLKKSGAIQIKDVNGRKKIVRRKHRRGIGKVEQRVPEKKQIYVKLTRKLRGTARGLLAMKKINNEQYRKIRTMIKASRFKSRRHLIESLKEI
jgi:large subunit ribosomal protein L19e